MTTAVARAESLRGGDYAAFMRCGSGNRWLPDAEAQLSSWLRARKRYDISLDVSADYSQPDSTLVVRRLTGDDRDDLRIRLVEDQGSNGTWTTDFIAHDEPGADDWIQLIVRNDRGQFAKVPALARFLVQSLPLSDGSIEFADKPQVFHEQDADRLISLLADERRHGLVFVAGTASAHGLPFDPYVRQVGRWAGEVYGLAQVVVLDPAATAAFARRVGDRYAAPAWTIRTYRPGTDFADAGDFRRHRILGTERLVRHRDNTIRQLLGDIVRQHAATRPADPDVLRVQRRFARYENRRLVEAVETEETIEVAAAIEAEPVVEPSTVLPNTPETATSELEATVAAQEQQLALVRRLLGVSAITADQIGEALTRVASRNTDRQAIKALEQRVDELQWNAEVLEDRSQALDTALGEAQYETEFARLEVDEKVARIRWLETRLKDAGDYEAPYIDAPQEFHTSYPEGFEELLSWVEKLDGVQFTGDASEVFKLNDLDRNNAAVRTAWDAVLCLADYVKARNSGNWTHGLDQYITNAPSGYRTISKGKWGRSETAATMNAYGDDRVFAVPKTVNPSGLIVMTAHFKLAKIGMRSPRMYVHDGHPALPCVYIGYIGEHLTNMQTN